MRKSIAYIGTYLFYFLGNSTCKMMFKERKKGLPKYWMVRLFTIYNTFMLWSTDIQDWGKLKGPWIKPETTHDKRRRILKDFIDDKS